MSPPSLCRKVNISASTCCSDAWQADDVGRRTVSEAKYKLRKAKSLVNHAPFISPTVTVTSTLQRERINVWGILWRRCNQQASCIMERRLHRKAC